MARSLWLRMSRLKAILPATIREESTERTNATLTINITTTAIMVNSAITPRCLCRFLLTCRCVRFGLRRSKDDVIGLGSAWRCEAELSFQGPDNGNSVQHPAEAGYK